MEKEIREMVNRLTVNPVRWDCSLAPFTSFGIGGPADAVITVESADELGRLMQFFADNDILYQFIGRGTNLLVKDSGFAGVILIPGKGLSLITLFEGDESASACIRVGAGCSLNRLLTWCVEHSYTGLEFVSGIPGSLGGAVVMNAGAWGKELSDVLVSVSAMNTLAVTETVTREKLDFSYRSWNNLSSNDEKMIVLAADLLLQKGEQSQIAGKCREYLEKRKMKQPKGVKSGGSFFKNPDGDSAGRLIEAAGLKGKCCGDAMISEVHANFLVNRGAATADDVLQLMHIVQKQVAEDSGVLLESEVHFL